MGLQEDFEQHVGKANALPRNIPKKEKDMLYGLYMHATYGPVMTPRPGLHNRKDPQEWEAWKAVEAKSREEAMSEYTNKVRQLFASAV